MQPTSAHGAGQWPPGLMARVMRAGELTRRRVGKPVLAGGA